MSFSILYWINPYGKILKQAHTTHIQQVTKNPAVFGVSRDYIEKVYKKHDEQVGNEGDAREEIMEYLFKRGFIRARLYVNKYWSITLSNFTPKAKRSLAKWAEDASKDKSSGKFMPVKILDTRSNKLYQDWTVNDIKYDKHLYEGEEVVDFHPEIIFELKDLAFKPKLFKEFINV